MQNKKKRPNSLFFFLFCNNLAHHELQIKGSAVKYNTLIKNPHLNFCPTIQKWF